MNLRKKHKGHLTSVGLVTALSLAFTACSADGTIDTGDDGGDSTFYEGQSVEIVVPYAPGGGTDITARFLAPILSETVAGNPDVQVVNNEGANTLLGSNEFAMREPDGMSWFVSGAATTFNYILDHPDAEYSYADWTPIIGSPQGNVVYVSPSTGIEEPAQLLESSEKLILPVQSVEGSDLVRIVALELLGVDFDVVSGYDGGSSSRVAFEQGEANINGDTVSTYLENVVPLVEAGDAIPMFSFGYPGENGEIVRDVAAPDIPHIGEVYEMIHGTPPEGEAWEAYKVLLNSYILQKILWIPDDAPAEAIEALQAAAAKVPEHPDYAADGADVLGGYDLVVGEELTSAVESVSNPDPDAVQWVYDFLETEHDITLGG